MLISKPALRSSRELHSSDTPDGLRVALFSGNYNYVMDGPVRALNRLVGHLERRGVEVRVFSPTTDKPAFQHEGTLVSVPSVAVPGRPEYRIGLGLPRSVRKQVEAFNPNLIHLAAPDFLGSAALKFARANSIPAVASFHTRFDTYLQYYGLTAFQPLLTNHLKRFYARCEHVYVPCESMGDELRADGLAENLRIWSRGVDEKTFTPKLRCETWRAEQGFGPDDVVISFVGRLVLEKGLKVFSDALDILRARGVAFKVLVVGDGPERERLAQWIPEAVFTGFLKEVALGRAYACSDIFLNPSITETFGNVTLEAMAAGVPAVCANATGSRSLVDQGVTGFMAEDNRAETFADHLQRLIEDPMMRQRMRVASIEKARNYQWPVILDGLLQDYESLVSTGRSVLADEPAVTPLAETDSVAGQAA